jgi:septal ring factor EnvC (AmiA/AmiB activator)
VRLHLVILLCFCLVGLFLEQAARPGWVCAQSEGSLEIRLDSQNQELEDLKKEINQLRSKSNELVKEEASVIRRLSAIEKEIELSGRLFQQLIERENLLTEQIDSLQSSVTIERSALKVQEVRLRARLRQLYKREPNYQWEILLGSENIHHMLQRYKFLKIVAERDAILLAEVRDRKNLLEHEQAVLTEALADVAGLKTAQVEESEQLSSKKDERVAMLQRIRNEKSRHTKAIGDLEKAREELQDLIGQLEQRRKQETTQLGSLGDFSKLKGFLIQPVEGQLIRSFGRYRHPKFGTVTFNSGIDIQAPSGTPIRAVAKGVVEFMDWIAGYGKCVILNHGQGYYTLYAHVSALFVQPGREVEQGDVIAEVGDSGSLEGFACHFEIRKSKEALNPMEWFAK